MKLLEACFRKALWNLAESFAKQRIWGKRSFPNNRCKSSVFHNLIMMYSVTPFGFGWFLNLGLFLGLTYDLSVYVAPRMSKHYLKQCFIRYFNMQFSKNNVVSDFIIIYYYSLTVEIKGFEPLTPCLQGRCSPNWAIPPFSFFFQRIKMFYRS